jgi:hypothetical protein
MFQLTVSWKNFWPHFCVDFLLPVRIHCEVLAGPSQDCDKSHDPNAISRPATLSMVQQTASEAGSRHVRHWGETYLRRILRHWASCLREDTTTKLRGAEPFLRSHSRSATQRTFQHLWNLKVHYRANKIPPLIPILRQMNPVHTTPVCFSKIRLYIILQPMSRSS